MNSCEDDMSVSRVGRDDTRGGTDPLHDSSGCTATCPVYTDKASRTASRSLIIKQLQVVKRNDRPALFVRTTVAAVCTGATHSSSGCISVPHDRHIRIPRNLVQAIRTKAVEGCKHWVRNSRVGTDHTRGGTGSSPAGNSCTCVACDRYRRC